MSISQQTAIVRERIRATTPMVAPWGFKTLSTTSRRTFELEGKLEGASQPAATLKVCSEGKGWWYV